MVADPGGGLAIILSCGGAFDQEAKEETCHNNSFASWRFGLCWDAVQ
jgi:hypothetical protein